MVGALKAFDPVLVCGLRAGVAVGAIEQDDAVAVGRIGQQAQEVILRAPGFGEDDGLLGRTQSIQFSEGLVQGREQRLAFGVVADAGGQHLEVAQLVDLAGDDAPRKRVTAGEKGGIDLMRVEIDLRIDQRRCQRLNRITGRTTRE